jgi:hypothetical protein
LREQYDSSDCNVDGPRRTLAGCTLHPSRKVGSGDGKAFIVEPAAT